ncbi:hypothetical protein JCM5350_000179 [Sporobolomyces pararoseus]
MGHTGVQLSYESLPAPPELQDPEQESILGSIKRFFVPSAPTPHPHPTSTANTSNTSTPQREASPARPTPDQTRKDASTLPSAHQKLSALASAVKPSVPSPKPPPNQQQTEEGSPDPNASGITLPNGQKYTRRLRLSGVQPSVGVTVQNSDRGALVTSTTSRSLAGGEHGWQAIPGTATTGVGGGGMISSSPTTSEAFGGLTFKNLSSIPGFPLRGDAGEDTKSAWSVSTAANASPTVVQIFRRLQGEGLSQEYWMKDESSKACYDCETVFTVFRRKHHCRICGQIFCARCAAHLIPSARFGQQGHIRVCNLCFSKADHHARQHPHSHHHHHSSDDPLSASHPYPAPSYRPSFSQRPSSIRDNYASRASRPSSLYQSVSYPTWQHGAIDSIPQEEDDDGGPSRPRSPDADEVNEDPEAGDDSPRGRRSPMSSMRIQQEEREASRTRGDGGEGLEMAYSPTLSNATAPFRRELAEDEEGTAEKRERSDGVEEDQEQADRKELEEAKNGLGISMQVNGLGLDMSGISGSPPSSNKQQNGGLTPMTLEQALETGLNSSAVSQRKDSFTRYSRPASPSVLNSSTSSGIRQSPSAPHFGRSISRLSLSIPDGLRPQFSHLLSDNDTLEQQQTFAHPAEAPGDIPLSNSALLHIRKMISQALIREEVPNPTAWGPVLERLLLEMTDGPVPDIHAGDAMDVRRYMRIKKLPGGRPKDSEFIDGVIFTKNLLHKKMSRTIENPRIAVVTCPIEYGDRPGHHYFNLEQLIESEPKFLEKQAKRIIDLRPHLVLFSGNVPRLALDQFVDRNIAVTKYVKPEAIMAVSRATQATIIDSFDILSSQPELGRCKKFRVQTFVHELIPDGKKTFLRFEGCKRELGCTILLRGGSMETLAKIKKIVNMLALVAYNAKLEGYLFYDERLDLLASPSDTLSRFESASEPPLLPTSQNEPVHEDLSATVKLEDSKTRLITQTLDPYRSTALSSSSLVRFPPPYPLTRMADEDRHLRELRDARDADETRKIIEEEAASRAQSISAGSSSTSLSSSHQPSISSVLIDAATLAQGASTQKVLQKPEEVAKMQEVAEAEESYSERLVVWNEYREKNHDSFDPEDHQRLYILESLLCGKPEEPKKVCKPPAVVAVTFYGSEDLTISQYIARIVREFGQECTSPSCHEPMSDHSRIFVHGDCRIQTSIDRYDLPPDEGFPPAMIGLQTSCERCDCQSRLTRMSDSTSRLSFHKFLELSFYPSERLVCGDQSCPHDAHLDHTRYWYFRGARITIKMQRIDLRDVVAPPRIVKVKPDTQLVLRNSEYEVVQQRTKAFFDSVQARINAFRLDCVQVQRLEECKAALADFSSRCEADRRTVLRLLVSAYEQSQETNGTEMTGVRRALQEKVVQFEADWTLFEKRVILSEQDSRRSSKRYSPDSVLSLSPGRRSVSGSLPPSIEVEEESAASSSEMSNSVSSTTNDTQHSTESSTDSTTTVHASPELANLPPLALDPPALSIEDTSSSTVSPTATSTDPSTSPATDLRASTSTVTAPPSRPPVASDNSDMESDSTICADSRCPSISGHSSPFIRNHPRGSNEQSPAEESEPEEQRPVVRRRKTGQLVGEIIQSFEAGSISRSDSLRSTKTAKSPDRPGLRRGHTDKPRSTKIRPPGPFPLSDGDNSYARNVGVFHLLDSPAAAKPTRIPAPARSRDKPPTSLDYLRQPQSHDRTAWSPPGSPDSSRPASRTAVRPPNKSFSRTRSPNPSRPQSPTLIRADGHKSPTTSRSRSTSRPTSPIAFRSRPPLKSFGSSRSTIKGKAADRDQTSRVSESSDAGRASKPKPRGLGLSRPTASTTNKMVGRRVVSTGVGRVKQMSKQWEGYAARQAQRKRARPVIATQPTVQIFTNVRDAAKEDSDEEAHQSHNESDGADDEFDNDPDGGEKEEEEDASDREEQHRGRSASSKTSPKSNSAQLISCSTPNVSMADVLARSLHHNLNENVPTETTADPMARDVDLLNLRPESAMYDLSNFASDSDFPSFPSSPMLGGHSHTMPRMSEGESSGTDKSSYFRGLLNGLFLFRNGEFSQLQYPLLPSEHLFSDNPILLRDDEPSSIIAFALSSKIYSQSVEATKLSPASLASQPNLPSDVPSPPTIEDFLRRPDEASLRIATEDASLSASCKIFFAEHFEALRRQCGCEKQFIESLSRCYKWDSAGGKSKADFMKTLDDRFIVKQLSSWEVDVLSSFLPAYFSYLADCLFKGQPTVLAKIFGIYRISFGKKYKNLDFLVMENLFYGRQLKQIFDLKGSTRNRRADQNNPVLLDENLMEISLKTPIYVREESQNFIRQAIYNDSQFLSDLNVMDYSLVIGVDSAKQELVVGIVDFIRTYTWNKRIESWVKETTFIGGASKAGGPTIITPKQYKMRFREAIDGYLQLSPSPWLSAESLKTLTAGQRNVVQQPQQQSEQAEKP